MNRLRLLLARGAAAALAVLVMAMPAIAQATGGGPPMPTINRSPHPVIGFGIMFVLLVAVVTVSLMPSKRGHQD